MFYKPSAAIRQMNDWGRRKIPFLFITDFELENIVLFPAGQWVGEGIDFELHTRQDDGGDHFSGAGASFQVIPVSFARYRQGFDRVLKHIRHGNSYLLNLTFPSEIVTNCSLEEIYRGSRAPYKLYWKDHFTVFSPEPFIRIRDRHIYSNPMKGTIDADLPDARQRLLADAKELAEHYTIVDLIRNDLNRVASHVRVDRFRYFDTIKSRERNLFQTSSEISGTLPRDWNARIGQILFDLLPAGSVSGAPKAKTLEIIREAEMGPRGYYTGVFGYFDGEGLDSGVMIRFIELQDGKMIFRSGGGITAGSRCASEYEELKNKIYVPIV